MPQERVNQVLEIDQRVVTFIDGHPVRGTVRYIGQEEDATEDVHTIVGLEMVGNPNKIEFVYHKHLKFYYYSSVASHEKNLTHFCHVF